MFVLSPLLGCEMGSLRLLLHSVQVLGVYWFSQRFRVLIVFCCATHNITQKSYLFPGGLLKEIGLKE